jgi:hypothetical protein
VFSFVNDDANDLEAGNDPLYLASFLFTPYFHSLLDHIPDLLKAGDLRCFAGQNFEKMNNDHRLYWQLTNKQKGKEIPAIMDHHLRVRMNPVRAEDRNHPGSLQCPHCTHPRFTKPQWFKDHVTTEHGAGEFTRVMIDELKADKERCLVMLRGPVRRFAEEVVTEFERIRDLKRTSNAKYYKHTREKRKQFAREWKALNT